MGIYIRSSGSFFVSDAIIKEKDSQILKNCARISTLKDEILRLALYNYDKNLQRIPQNEIERLKEENVEIQASKERLALEIRKYATCQLCNKEMKFQWRTFTTTDDFQEYWETLFLCECGNRIPIKRSEFDPGTECNLKLKIMQTLYRYFCDKRESEAKE